MRYDTRLFLLSLCLLSLSLLFSQRLFLPSNTRRTDILIVSPHPDDAILCCAGLIQQSLDQGKRIRIVELTDGDGYAEAAALLARKPAAALTPRDFLRLGRVRTREELRAMNTLGISRRDITFLGYPDGWLDEVSHADNHAPFPSTFTGLSRSPHSGHPYTGPAVTRDLSWLITRYRPRQIYVSGAFDTALDHQVAYRLTHEAIRVSGYAGQVFTYTNHAPDRASLPDPALRLTLTSEERRTKTTAIAAYGTQLPLDGEFLHAFAAEKEVFY